MEKLLEVRGLRTHFHTDRGLFRAVDGIDFSVGRGRTVGLVGESGCGKSVSLRALMRLLPPGRATIGGQIAVGGEDVLAMPPERLGAYRGGTAAMILHFSMYWRASLPPCAPAWSIRSMTRNR